MNMCGSYPVIVVIPVVETGVRVREMVINRFMSPLNNARPAWIAK
jgi:hypothetical protein